MFPRTLCAAILLVACTAPASAQYPLPPLGRGLAPLLHVKLYGPAGMRTVVYQGMAPPRNLPAPVQLGLRPGYIYRLELNNLVQYPGLSLYPTLEVRGTLALPPGVNAAGYPAPVVLTDDDVQTALSGTLVTKVIYLENPERATPAATTPDQPIETTIPTDRDPLMEARDRGRPVLVLRLGQRDLTPREVAQSSVPGTVLFPDEHVLGPPAAPPMLPWACFALYDPILGPCKPEEEWIHNGCISPPSARYLASGRPQHAGLDNDGVLQGINAEDTVAEYKDSRGRRQLTCSNRVCLFVPRFAVLRTATGLGRFELAVAVQNRQEVRGGEQVATRQPPLITTQLEFARAVLQKTAASCDEVITLTQVEAHVVGGPLVASQVAITRDVTGRLAEAPAPPERPLVLAKDVDKHSGLPGDIVTFTLRYSNGGGVALSDVTVVDSLSARLEYIPDSAQSERDAVFTMQENEVGSLVLRWEVNGKLLPGDSGIIRFKAKVR